MNICEKDIDLIYDKLSDICKVQPNNFVSDTIVTCLQNYDGETLPVNCTRQEEIKEKLPDLLDESGGRFFRFNHGAKYFSTEIFPTSPSYEYVSQFDRAIELINYKHNHKAVMQVILPDMIQGNIVPIPAAISVILKPKKISNVNSLDVVAVYRVQEFSTWWPLNVLELFQIQAKALQNLTDFSAGDIVTISIQGHWDPNVPLANKSLLDAKESSISIAESLIVMFNFGADTGARDLACGKVIEALKEKQRVTSLFSYDAIGLDLLSSKLQDIKVWIGSTKLSAGNNETLMSWKSGRDKIEELLKRIKKELGECSERYNRENTAVTRWHRTMHTLFDELIKEFEMLRTRIVEWK